MTFYKFPFTPKNVVLFVPRMVGVAGVLLVMVGYMVKHMARNKRTIGVYWDDID